MKYPRTYYMIFDKYDCLLNITYDYFYFKRLVKKYQKENKEIILKSINSINLLEISSTVNI